jgi:hypothetical protein
MACARKRLLPLFGAAAALALGGCVDMFTSVPPPDAVSWRGTTSAGNPEFAECGSFALELGQYQPPAFMWNTVSGRAWPTAVPETQLDKIAAMSRQWWLEGYVTPANFVEFETKLQQPIYFRARPYSVWRGTIAEDRMVLTESGSPCNREVVLVRG